MHEKNSFITLTYAPEHLKSTKLVYEDFQKFMKKLRKLQNQPIGVFVTGEYGTQGTLRPHWHAIIFGWYPSDATYHRTTSRGDRIFISPTLDRLWGKNDPINRPCEIGEVNFLTAGYVARYATKKIEHGANRKVSEADHHEWQPISKKSQKNAIGKKFLEKYWQDIFNGGRVILFDGTETTIPRYYEKWLQKNQPDAWNAYVTRLKADRILRAQEKSDDEKFEEIKINSERKKKNPFAKHQRTKLESAKIILESKYKILQNFLKL